jgi:hypothetical protein
MKLIASLPAAWAAGFSSVHCEVCNRTMPFRQVSTRKVGIRLQGSWCCSAPCFTTCSEREISRLLKSATDSGHAPRMPLGLNLINRGLLTVEQLKRVTEEQRETGCEIGELLVLNGMLTERQLTTVRAADWGCAVFSLPKHPTPVSVSIPRALVSRYSMIPVHHVAATNLLLIGFVHSVEYGLLYAIEQMTGCQTKPCFITPSDFCLQNEQNGVRELVFEDTHSVAGMARILCDHGLEMEADEALLANAKEYMWGRLRSASNTLDLIFQTS